MQPPASDLRELVESRDWPKLRESLDRLSPPETADLLFDLEPVDRIVVFRMLPRPAAAEVFAYLPGTAKDQFLKELTDSELRPIIAGLRPDDRTHLLEQLPGQMIQRLLNLLEGEQRREARELLGYPEESVGRLMTPSYVAVRPTWTVEASLRHIRQLGPRSETIGVIYVTDEHWKLLGAIPLDAIVLADPTNSIANIMPGHPISITPEEDREKAVQILLKHDLFILPVTDGDGVLLGIVTVDDVLDVAELEATEDIQMVGAVSPLRHSYRDASIFSLYGKRMPWLASLVLVNLAASGVIAAYEQTLASVITLTFFIPLLLGSGGNAGAQAATLTVRAISTGDLERGAWLRSAGKELIVGLLVGGSMGILALALGFVRGGFEVAVVVSVSMIIIVILANLVGVSLPFLLTRLNIDPAVASNPLITSIADVTGLAVYLAVATTMLHIP